MLRLWNFIKYFEYIYVIVYKCNILVLLLICKCAVRGFVNSLPVKKNVSISWWIHSCIKKSTQFIECLKKSETKEDCKMVIGLCFCFLWIWKNVCFPGQVLNIFNWLSLIFPPKLPQYTCAYSSILRKVVSACIYIWLMKNVSQSRKCCSFFEYCMVRLT